MRAGRQGRWCFVGRIFDGDCRVLLLIDAREHLSRGLVGEVGVEREIRLWGGGELRRRRGGSGEAIWRAVEGAVAGQAVAGMVE